MRRACSSFFIATIQSGPSFSSEPLPNFVLLSKMKYGNILCYRYKSLKARRDKMECRVGCGACCIAPSISSAIPGMPGGKPAGVRCVQLTSDNRCRLFGKPERPEVCKRLRPSEEMCGHSAQDALIYLTLLEQMTSPVAKSGMPTHITLSHRPFFLAAEGFSRQFVQHAGQSDLQQPSD